jgi:chemotaxis protein histidine kinase CheA
MSKTFDKKAQVIASDSYPQMMSRHSGVQAAQTLRSHQTTANAQSAIEAFTPTMRKAILQYVEELEKAEDDMATIFAKAHEIRGFAETAGLVTTGRIAEILCRYMDDMERIKRPLDPTLVALNIAAIGRAARTEDTDPTMGEAVATELTALIARRLADASQA